MAFSFGSNTSTSNVGFGAAAAAKPTFSFGGGTTTTTASTGFGGFGTATSTSGFGTFGATTSTAAPFGGLSGAATTSAPSLFGGGGFGSTAAKPATGFGNTSFGAGSTFGTAQPAFGSTAPTFGTTSFGGGSTFGTGSTFGSTFGTKPATTGFGGFGTGLGTTAAAPFGQQAQQQAVPGQPAAPATAQEALVAAVFNCNVFGDERDQVLAKWNLLQAQWGTGQAYYNRNAPPLDLNEHNPLCRFKAVGYSKLDSKEDKEGYVALQFNKPEQEVKNNKQTMITSLQGLLGNKPNLAVTIDSIEPLSESKTQITIYVSDSSASGARIMASELSNFLNAGTAKMALNSGGCSTVTAVKRPGDRELTHYLNSPPPGMDMRMWKQAQTDNPDPDNYIPVPIVGFSEIKVRWASQSRQAALQAEYLAGARGALESLRARRAAAAGRLARLRAAHHALRHDLLQIIARQEVSARMGSPLTPEEEAIKARLDEMVSQLAAPPLNNGRLNELLCAVRLQRSSSAGAPQERYHLDPGAQEDVKQFLALQQKGMAHLLDTARKDLAALDTIAEGMSRLVRA